MRIVIMKVLKHSEMDNVVLLETVDVHEKIVFLVVFKNYALEYPTLEKALTRYNYNIETSRKYKA